MAEQTPKAAIEIWLTQRVGAKDMLTALSADRIAAIMMDPRQGIAELFAAHNRKAPKDHRIAELARQLPKHEGINEQSDRQKVDAAYEEARRSGLIEIQDFGDPTWAKRCDIIGSTHASTTGRSATPDQLDAQYQLFMLLQLFERFGVRSMFHAEGALRDDQPAQRVEIILGNETLDIRSAKGQQYFAKHPQHFKKLLTDLMRDRLDATFFCLTSYPHIRGIHTPEVIAEVRSVKELMCHQRIFAETYLPVVRGTGTVRPVLQEGLWKFLINNRWHDPKVVMRDAEKEIEFCNRFAANNAAREQEVVANFAAASAEHMPIHWVGYGHVEAIKAGCLSQGMSVRTIVPTADKHEAPPVSLLPDATNMFHLAQIHVAANERRRREMQQ